MNGAREAARLLREAQQLLRDAGSPAVHVGWLRFEAELRCPQPAEPDLGMRQLEAVGA